MVGSTHSTSIIPGNNRDALTAGLPSKISDLCTNEQKYQREKNLCSFFSDFYSATDVANMLSVCPIEKNKEKSAKLENGPEFFCLFFFCLFFFLLQRIRGKRDERVNVQANTSLSNYSFLALPKMILLIHRSTDCLMNKPQQNCNFAVLDLTMTKWIDGFRSFSKMRVFDTF